MVVVAVRVLVAVLLLLLRVVVLLRLLMCGQLTVDFPAVVFLPWDVVAGTGQPRRD